MEKTRDTSSVRGFAVLEVAAWSIVLLPVAIMGAVLSALAHDQNIVQVIPDTLLRETTAEVITWQTDGAQGEFVVDSAMLTRSIERLADRGLSEVTAQVFKLEDLSAQACFWSYRVNPQSGFPELVESSACVFRGARGEALALDEALASRLVAGVAIPLRVSGGGEDFVSRVVLFGLAVGGVFKDIPFIEYRQDVQHGAVWVPRKEVTL